MFGHEKKRVTGAVRTIRRRRVFQDGQTIVTDEEARNEDAGIEVLTFSLLQRDQTESPESGLTAELITRGKTHQLEEGDEVELEGIWKPRSQTLTVTTLINRTKGARTSGSRFV